MPCPECLKDPHPEGCGSPRNCAFKEGVFTPNNWCCGTMRLLRRKAYETAIRHEDHGTAVFGVPDEHEQLVMHWYKDRGCTQLCIILSGAEVRTPSLEEVQRFAAEGKILEYCL